MVTVPENKFRDVDTVIYNYSLLLWEINFLLLE